MLSIKVTNPREESWYKDEKHAVFGVIRMDSKGYCVKELPGESHWIRKEDCEEVH